MKFSLSGKLLQQIQCAQNAYADDSIGVNAAGNIYTSSECGGWVGRYNAEGILTAISEIGNNISVDAGGNVYVDEGRITIYHAS